MAPTWKIGDRLAERWEIHRILPGDTGVVYVVYDHQEHEPLAVKTLHEALVTNYPQLVENFIQGARVWIDLDVHFNVTQACFLEMIDERPYLFLEYVAGGSLESWIGLPRLSHNDPQLLRFGLHFCDAMIHAALQGLPWHGNIQPANCLLNQDNVLKLTDFAIAKGFTTPLEVGILAAYVAPECWEKPQNTVRADVYAFGTLFYEMLTGKPPFGRPGEVALETLFEHHKTAPCPALGEAQARFAPLMEACLAKDPEQRPADFRAVREQLAALYKEVTGTTASRPLVGTALHAAGWDNTGAGLSELGRHQEALVCYNNALHIEQLLDTALVHRGTALDALGQPQEALENFDQALGLNPRSEAALLNKGIVLGGMGQSEPALECFQRVVTLNPHAELAWFNMGVVLSNTGQAKEALVCYNRALTLNPGSELAWFSAGNALDDLGRTEEAFACYDRTLALNPRQEMAWVNKGLSLTTLGRGDEALACFDQALALNPLSEQAWFNKGVLLAQHFERYQEALPCFEEAHRLGHSQAADGIATCRQALGQK